MNPAFALVPVAAAVLALATTPALAKSERHQQRHSYAQPYYGPAAWRSFPDPSFGNRAGIDNARTNNRCVVDLGYGRYEYCD